MLIPRTTTALLFTLFALLSAAPLDAQVSRRVVGRVIDAHQAQPLPGVTVAVVGTALMTTTGVDGRYVLDLAPGKYQIHLSVPGFSERTLNVEVQPTGVTEVQATLAISGLTESVTVSAEGDASTMAVQLLERRRSMVITDNLGSQEMKANADSNAASALQRVTGLSVVDNQYVFVRGLGERYSNTMLNGALVPSTEPERKVVSLDMFPASLLESVSVVKSFTPDRSAEFAGGLVEIVPTRLPSRRLANFSYTFGANTSAWRKDVLDHGSGSRDWLGLPNADRGLPAAFPDRRLIRGGIFTPEVGVSSADLERFGEMLPNEWSPRTVSGTPNQGFSAAFGDRWGGFGLSASVNQSYKQDYQEEKQTYFSQDDAGSLSPFSTYDYNVGSAQGTLAALINAAYAISSTDRLTFQAFSTDKGKRETRTFQGFNDDAGRNLRNSRLLWQEERLRSFQFGGDHFLRGAPNSTIEWRGSVSRSSRDEPDVRETLYQELVANSGVFTLADESQSGLRLFNDLDEEAWDIGASWNMVFSGPRGLPATFKFGPSVSNRARDFSSRRFRFVPINSIPQTVVRFDLSQAPEQIFSPANIGPRYELREETRATDTYDAEQRVVAGYGVLDFALGANSRLVAGARVEQFRQTVDTFDPFDLDLDGDPALVRGQIEETDIFPAFNFVQDLGGSQNLRIGFSQTVNRPEFRELAPFEFTDIVGGRAVVGNPDLERSLIRNVDVRWEWFPGATEVVAASVFFKSFAQPIERVVEPTAQLRTSFDNAESARNVGLELEGRREIFDGLTLGANYTFVDSNIQLRPSQQNVLTNLDRPLAGTSKHTVNGVVEAHMSRLSTRLLVNFVGARIVDVGSLGLPDIYEEGRATVDLIATLRLAAYLNLRFAAENLGDQPVRFLQGSETHREYSLGRAFSLQFSFSN